MLTTGYEIVAPQVRARYQGDSNGIQLDSQAAGLCRVSSGVVTRTCCRARYRGL